MGKIRIKIERVFFIKPSLYVLIEIYKQTATSRQIIPVMDCKIYKTNKNHKNKKMECILYLVLFTINKRTTTPNATRDEYLICDINREMSLNVPVVFFGVINPKSAQKTIIELINKPNIKEKVTFFNSKLDREGDVPIIIGKKSKGSFILKSLTPSEKICV